MDKLDKQNKRVKSEVNRLTKIFKGISPEKKSVARGLIIQAARLRVLLDDAWKDIQENGDVELFTQSESTPPYERERPVAKHFNQRDAAYQKIIGQLVRLLSEEEKEEVKDEVGDLL